MNIQSGLGWTLRSVALNGIRRHRLMEVGCHPQLFVLAALGVEVLATFAQQEVVQLLLEYFFRLLLLDRCDFGAQERPIADPVELGLVHRRMASVMPA